MAFDQDMVHSLYKKLLRLYPREFREHLEESLEQTFNDLYKEQKSQTERGLFGFALWMFLETGTRILREHILVFRQRGTMKNILANHNSTAITSLILALPLGLTYLALMFNIEPFARLLKNLFTIDGQQGEIQINMLGRIVIYGGLLLLPLAFALNLQPKLKREGTEGRRRLYAINLIVGAAILLLIVFTWGGLFVDEIYCLSGIRCD
jgi:hypothetical protein